MAGPAEISKLDVVLTAGCNLRCSYCYQNDKKARSIAWETLRASADLVLGSKRPSVKMLFIGGEPLLEFPLMQRAVAYIEERRRPDQQIKYQIVTNGTLLGDEPLAFFADHDFDVQLSFDGVPGAQAFRSRDSFEVLDRLLTRTRNEWPTFFFENLSVSLTLIVPAVRYLADSIDILPAETAARDCRFPSGHVSARMAARRVRAARRAVLANLRPLARTLRADRRHSARALPTQ